jgi:hypothetical protein
MLLKASGALADSERSESSTSQKGGGDLMVKWKSVAGRVVPAMSFVALVVVVAAGKKWG